MGTDCALILANLFLFHFEYSYIKEKIKRGNFTDFFFFFWIACPCSRRPPLVSLSLQWLHSYKLAKKFSVRSRAGDLGPALNRLSCILGIYLHAIMGIVSSIVSSNTRDMTLY